MRFIYILTLIGLVFVGCVEQKPDFTSPDRNISVLFHLDSQGIPYYQVVYKSDTIIDSSRLGLKLENNPMDSALQLVSLEVIKDKIPYNYNEGKAFDSKCKYNELTAKVQREGQEMDIIFRIYNQGIAIRYWLRGYENIVIGGDATEINFPKDVQCFWSPEEVLQEKNNYYRSSVSGIQEAYKSAIPNEPKYGAYPNHMYLSFPFLVNNGNGKYLNFQQVQGYKESYFALRLDPVQTKMYTSVRKDKCSEQVVTLPYYTHWLLIGIANSSEELLESSMAYHLGIEEEAPKKPERHPIQLYENNCYNNVILPFSRHYEGGREYSLMNIETGAHSTLAHQLGLHVVFNRPLSVYTDYKNKNPKIADMAYHFIRDLPLEWSEMRVMKGELGKYVVVARKDAHSNNWFVGGITDGSAREITIDFDFLSPNKLYKATVYEDAPNSDWLENPSELHVESAYVRKENSFLFRLACGGGFGVIFKEVKNP